MMDAAGCGKDNGQWAKMMVALMMLGDADGGSAVFLMVGADCGGDNVG